MCLTVSHTWTWTDARKLSHSVIVCRLAIYRPAYAVCLFVLHARQGTCETVCVERVRELAGVSCVTWPLYCSASLGPCTVESRVRSGLITALSCCARSSPDRPVRAALGTRAALSPRSLRLRDGTWEMRCRPLLQQPHLVLYFTYLSNAKLYHGISNAAVNSTYNNHAPSTSMSMSMSMAWLMHTALPSSCTYARVQLHARGVLMVPAWCHTKYSTRMRPRS